ncbi:MAG TPA: choice-of-anchor tandem repeat GloVer-containing protein [Rhizomicrobium sp.]|nr:choice-of-anchor tandem repeat GloVer-containing protein [Rhizomicrobium sp.]
MPYDGTSPLYGTTEIGGAANEGVVFEAVPGAKEWTLSTIYDFCSQPNCADGSLPQWSVSVDAKGNIDGATSKGGTNLLDGTIFLLSPKHGGPRKEKVLYDFCSEDQCADGTASNQLVFDAEGDMLGTVGEGGAHGKGVLFKLKKGGKHQGYTVLHDFCAEKKCTDGAVPEGLVTVDASGNMFGTTTVGGTGFKDASHQGGGTIFEISGGHYQTLSHARGNHVGRNAPRGVRSGARLARAVVFAAADRNSAGGACGKRSVYRVGRDAQFWRPRRWPLVVFSRAPHRLMRTRSCTISPKAKVRPTWAACCAIRTAISSAPRRAANMHEATSSRCISRRPDRGGSSSTSTISGPAATARLAWG